MTKVSTNREILERELERYSSYSGDSDFAYKISRDGVMMLNGILHEVSQEFLDAPSCEPVEALENRSSFLSKPYGYEERSPANDARIWGKERDRISRYARKHANTGRYYRPFPADKTEDLNPVRINEDNSTKN